MSRSSDSIQRCELIRSISEMKALNLIRFLSYHEIDSKLHSEYGVTYRNTTAEYYVVTVNPDDEAISLVLMFGRGYIK